MMRVNMDDITRDQAEYVLYNGERFTGEVVETTDDGTVIGVNTYLDGSEDGPQREFYYDGAPRAEYWMVNGKVSGEARVWHENGQLARLQHWNEYGEMTKHEEWDENGRPDPA